MFINSVLNAACAAATAKFDKLSLHTADPGDTGANEDTGATQKTLTWSSPSGGISTASATWTGRTGSWTHVGFWDSTTFVGSRPFRADESAVVFVVANNLTVAVAHTVTTDA